MTKKELSKIIEVLKVNGFKHHHNLSEYELNNIRVIVCLDHYQSIYYVIVIENSQDYEYNNYEYMMNYLNSKGIK